MDSVADLRTIARWVLIFAVAASGIVIFLGLPMFSIGSVDEAIDGAGSPPVIDEEEVLLEEYLGLGDEDARQEVEMHGAFDDENNDEGHA